MPTGEHLNPYADDPYAELGLSPGCSPAEVKAAYRRLAKIHHPDRNPESSAEAADRARRLNAAYAVLGDPALRHEYDRAAGHAHPSPASTRPASPARAGRGRRDIAHDVHLDVEELLRGTSREIRIDDPANADGPETYTLTVPAETAPGTRFRLPRGGPFAGGMVVVRVRARPGGRFRVSGSDLRTELRISAQRAAQGGAESVPGASGRLVRVNVPAGVGRGEVLRVAGEGLPKSRGGRGDLLVRVTYRPEVSVTHAPAKGGWRWLR